MSRNFGFLEPFLTIPENERLRALDRISRAKAVEENGFHYFQLPAIEEEERHLFRRPEAMQFHYKGKLYKVAGERASGVFELFLDLLYVAILATFSQDVAHNPDWIHMLKFVVIFFHAYQIWQDLREVFDNYYTDDILQRALVLVVMGGMAIFANNAAHIGVDDKYAATAYRSAVYAYQLVHLILILNWLFYSLFIPEHLVRMRLMGLVNVGTFLIRTSLLFVESWTARVIIAFAAYLIERAFWAYIYSPMFLSHDSSEFSTAVNIEHESDRMTALYIIVLGEFFNGVILQSKDVFGFHAASGRLLLVLVIAFSLNWLYVHNDGSLKNTHALRRSAVSAIIWFVAHEPLSASFVLSGDIASDFVKSSVLEEYNHQWIFCYGLGVGVLSLWLLAQCTLAREELIWPKQVRLLMRLVDAIVFFLLPLTHLNTTKTLSVCAGVLVVTVVWENYGSLSKNWIDRICYVPNSPSNQSRPTTAQHIESEVESLLHANETTVRDGYGSVREP